MFLPLFATVFLSFTLNLVFAAVHTHRMDSVRKSHWPAGRGSYHAQPSYVKRGIEIEQDPSSQPADLQRMLEGHPDSHEHSFMMIAASSGDSEGMFGGGKEDAGTISFEMLIMDFGETEETSNQNRHSTVPTIEAVKTVKRILPPPTFPSTLRSQQITAETRAKANRLKFLADMSASERADPFMRLAESLGAAMAARDAEASRTTQAEPTEASEAKLSVLPTVVQKAPQSQNTFTLAEEKTFDNYNTSHHSQL